MTEKITAMEVKTIRKKLGLTQVQMAEKMGVTHSAVCLWERGRRVPSGLASAMLKILAAEAKKSSK